MALSKTFAVGELLTAQDVNTHTANHVPNPGAAFHTDLMKLPQPAGTGWNTHTVHTARVGMSVYLVCNTQLGTSPTGTVLAQLPSTDLYPPVPWEADAIVNSGGASPASIRISTTGEVVAFWAAGPTNANYLRFSAGWPTGLTVAP